MYGSRAVTLLVLISDDVINRILKLNIQTNILVYVTRCCTDLTSKVLKERTFGQSSALLILYIVLVHKLLLEVDFKIVTFLAWFYSTFIKFYQRSNWQRCSYQMKIIPIIRTRTGRTGRADLYAHAFLRTRRYAPA